MNTIAYKKFFWSQVMYHYIMQSLPQYQKLVYPLIVSCKTLHQVLLPGVRQNKDVVKRGKI